MLPEHRRRMLLDYVKRQGAANVVELSSSLHVSEATVRRDLLVLEERGELERTHGGAILRHLGTAFEPPYAEKAARMAAAKHAIAAEAAKLVNDGDVIILDSGSTTYALALAVRERADLTVITTDIKIAHDLAAQPDMSVIVVGGRVRPQLYSVIGPFAEHTLREIHANTAFIGADAISTHAGVTNAMFEEVSVKRLAIESAGNRVLIADHTKFDKVSLAKVAGLDHFDLCITDDGIPREVLDRYGAVDLSITVAPKE